MEIITELKTPPVAGLKRSTMKALVYGGPGKIELKEVSLPLIEKPTDALVRILKTTICGTDLGILKAKPLPCSPALPWGMKALVLLKKQDRP